MTFGKPRHSLWQTREDRRLLVTSLANGFDFAGINGDARKWLRRRRLVLDSGAVTEKGRAWARELLAKEADELMAGNDCLDFGRGVE